MAARLSKFCRIKVLTVHLRTQSEPQSPAHVHTHAHTCTHAACMLTGNATSMYTALVPLLGPHEWITPRHSLEHMRSWSTAHSERNLCICKTAKNTFPSTLMLAVDNHQTNTCLTIMSALKLLFFSCCSKIKYPKPVMLRHLFQGCSTQSAYKISNHLGDFHLFFFFFFWKRNGIYTLSSGRTNVLCAGARTTAVDHLMHIFCGLF